MPEGSCNSGCLHGHMEPQRMGVWSPVAKDGCLEPGPIPGRDQDNSGATYETTSRDPE